MPFLFTCPHCGQQTSVLEQFAGQSGPCAACGRMVDIPPLAQPSVSDIGDNAAIRMLLPVGRSVLSILAGYAGLFALIPCFAPVAVILGILAIRDLKKHPEKHGMGRAIFGLVMGIVCTIGWIWFFSTAGAPGLPRGG
jgi:predicted acyltransferase